MNDPNLKLLCDKGHGEMQSAVFFADAGTQGPGFRCTICGRVWVWPRGYSEWEKGKPLGDFKIEGPRCNKHSKTFSTPMYVREQLSDGTLVYACSEENSTSTQKESNSG